MARKAAATTAATDKGSGGHGEKPVDLEATLDKIRHAYAEKCKVTESPTTANGCINQAYGDNYVAGFARQDLEKEYGVPMVEAALGKREMSTPVPSPKQEAKIPPDNADSEMDDETAVVTVDQLRSLDELRDWLEHQPLHEVVKVREQVIARVEELGGELSAVEGLEDTFDLVDSLSKGKIDRFCLMVGDMHDAYIEALEQQLFRVKRRQQQLMDYGQMVAEAAGGKLQGLTYTFAVQNNGGQAALVVAPDAKVPDLFKKKIVEIKVVFDPMDGTLNQKFTGMIEELQRLQAAGSLTVAKGEASVEIDNAALREALKTGTVEGCSLVRGRHARIKAASAKARSLKGGEG